MIPPAVQAYIDPWFMLLADDPVLRAVQLLTLALGMLVIFLVFFTTRDILLRTHSFLWMLVSIALVTFLPIVGFLLYLLVRPARTIREKENEEVLQELLMIARANSRKQPGDTKAAVVKKPKKKAAAKKKSGEDLSL